MIHNKTLRESWLHPLALERRIQILTSVYEKRSSTPADLARSLDCTRAESSRHVNLLTQKKYLEKVNIGSKKNKTTPDAWASSQDAGPSSDRRERPGERSERPAPGRPGQALRLAPRFSCTLAYLLPDGVEFEWMNPRLESLGSEKIAGWKTQGELLRDIRQKAEAKSGPDYRLYFCVDGITMPDLLVSWDGMPNWKPLSISRQKNSSQWQTGGALTFAGALAMGSALEGDLFVLHWNRGLKISYRSNGKLVLGERGTSSPIGHKELRESGRLCHCSRTNCLESLLIKPDAQAMRDVATAVRRYLGKKSFATSLLWSGPWESSAANTFKDFASSSIPDQGSILTSAQKGAKILAAGNLFRWELKREIA